MPDILIVDVNTFFRETLADILNSDQRFLNILQAGDGIEAMEVFRRHRPGIVFMDIHLPGESGIDVMKKIKAFSPDTAVIIFTSYDTPEYEEASFSSGADYFLSKRTSSTSAISCALDRIIRNKGSVTCSDRF